MNNKNYNGVLQRSIDRAASLNKHSEQSPPRGCSADVQVANEKLRKELRQLEAFLAANQRAETAENAGSLDHGE